MYKTYRTVGKNALLPLVVPIMEVGINARNGLREVSVTDVSKLLCEMSQLRAVERPTTLGEPDGFELNSE